MSYFRVTNNTGVLNDPDPALPVEIVDLGYTVADNAADLVLSTQFSPEDLQNSADLKAAINSELLAAQVNLDGTWVDVDAASFDGNDIYAAYANIYEITNTVDNQRLVNNTDCSDTTSGKSRLHHHDSDYYTETEFSAVADGASGANLVHVYAAEWLHIPIATVDVQGALDAIDSLLNTAVTLDDVYTNDADGIMLVNGVTKPLEFKSDGLNDVLVSRLVGTDYQQAILFDVSGDTLYLGAVTAGDLAAINVHIPSDLYVDGNVYFTGTITDQTVDNMNVTNANITLREGALVGADAYLYVQRGGDGADASLMWDDSALRWKAGTAATEETIGLLEHDDTVSGVWTFQGADATEPNMYLTNKAAAPSATLGTAPQYPVALINGQLAIYDRTNARNAFLSVSRQYATFSGRDHDRNKNEFLRLGGAFVSNKTGYRLPQKAMLVGITLEAAAASTWTARIRKNSDEVTNVASKAISAAKGLQDISLKVTFDAGDEVMVFLESAGDIDRPSVTLEFAYQYDVA